MNRKIAPALLVTAMLALAGCNKEQPAPVDTGATTAAGSVAGGTISDEMIPLDTLTSTATPEDGASASATPTEEAAN